MYQFLLGLHSLNRWIVLVLGVLAFLIALKKWLGNEAPATARDRLGLFFTISMDIQFLFGIGLYFVTPWMKQLTQWPAITMRDPVARFWSVEHVFGMVIALILVHVGRVVAKKATGVSRYKKTAIYFGLALLIMLLTTPWPFMKYGRALLPH